MAAECALNHCGVIGIGRCARCGRAFCVSHQAWEIGIVFVPDRFGGTEVAQRRPNPARCSHCGADEERAAQAATAAQRAEAAERKRVAEEAKGYFNAGRVRVLVELLQASGAEPDRPNRTQTRVVTERTWRRPEVVETIEIPLEPRYYFGTVDRIRGKGGVDHVQVRVGVNLAGDTIMLEDAGSLALHELPGRRPTEKWPPIDEVCKSLERMLHRLGVEIPDRPGLQEDLVRPSPSEQSEVRAMKAMRRIEYVLGRLQEENVQPISKSSGIGTVNVRSTSQFYPANNGPFEDKVLVSHVIHRDGQPDEEKRHSWDKGYSLSSNQHERIAKGLAQFAALHGVHLDPWDADA